MDSTTKEIAVEEANAMPGPITKDSGSETDRTSIIEKESPLAPVVSATDEEPEYPSGGKLALILSSLYLTCFLVALDRTIIATAIPVITNDFNSFQDIGWYGSSYLLTFSAFQLTMGRVYTFYPAKWIFMACVLLFEVGSAICGAAPTSNALIWGRAIAGLGSAGIFNGAVVIMIDAVPLAKRPMYQALFAAVFGIASVAGPLLGGAFTTNVTWRWCFYINLPIGGVAMAVILFVLKANAPRRAGLSWKKQVLQLDPVGIVLLVPAIVCLLLALEWGGSTYAWQDGRIIALLVLFGVLILGFAAEQYFWKEVATVPPRVISQRSVLAGGTYLFMLASNMMILVFYLPVWFQAIKGSSAVHSGIQNLPLVLSLVVASLLNGAIVSRTGYYVPSMYVGTVLMAIGSGLITTFRVDTGHSAYIGFQVLTGLGMGCGMQQPSLAIQTVLPRRDVSTGISLMFFAQTLGGAIFVSVSQNVLSNRLISGLRAANIPGIDPSSIVKVGATDLRQLVGEQYLPAVLKAYNAALVNVFDVGLAVACATIIGALAMEWRNLKKVAAERKAAADAAKAKGTESPVGEA